MGVPNWAIGVMLSFGGCCLSNFGVNLQKKSHLMIQQSGKKENYVSHPVWILGLGCVIMGSLGDLLSFAFADMSLLSPLGAMTLVVNMMVAPCFLKERLTIRDIIFTSIILFGTILSLMFGSKESKSYTLHDLLLMYIRPFFLGFFILLLLFLGLCFLLLRRETKRIEDGVAMAFEVQLVAFMYPALGGTFGAFSVLAAKSFAEIVKSTISGRSNEFGNPFTYLILIFLGASLFLQMNLLNAGLDKADALLIVPIYQVFWVTMNVLLSMIYFQDYKYISYQAMYFFAVGVMITLLGVYFLSNRTTQNITEYEEMEPECQEGQSAIQGDVVATPSTTQLEVAVATPTSATATTPVPVGQVSRRSTASFTQRKRTHTFHLGFHHSVGIETPPQDPLQRSSFSHSHHSSLSLPPIEATSHSLPSDSAILPSDHDHPHPHTQPAAHQENPHGFLPEHIAHHDHDQV